jgi:hypothetical protein
MKPSGNQASKKIIEWRSKSVHISSGNFFAVKSKRTYIAIDFGGANIITEYVHLIDCCSPTRIKPTKFVSDERPTQKYQVNNFRLKRGTSPLHRLHPLHRLRRPHLLLLARRRVTIDSIFRTTYFHLDLAASNNKAKCSSSESQLFVYFCYTRIFGDCAITILQQIHSTLGALPLLHYHKYIRLLGEFLFFGSGYISFGSVDLLSA